MSKKTAVSRKPTYKTKEDFLRWYRKRAAIINRPAAKPNDPPVPAPVPAADTADSASPGGAPAENQLKGNKNEQGKKQQKTGKE